MGCPPSLAQLWALDSGFVVSAGGAPKGGSTLKGVLAGFLGAVALRMGTGNGGISAWLLLTSCKQTAWGWREVGVGVGVEERAPMETRGGVTGEAVGGRGAEGQRDKVARHPPPGEGEEVPPFLAGGRPGLAPSLLAAAQGKPSLYFILFS